jgi:hypothetical protein
MQLQRLGQVMEALEQHQASLAHLLLTLAVAVAVHHTSVMRLVQVAQEVVETVEMHQPLLLQEQQIQVVGVVRVTLLVILTQMAHLAVQV